ncbi:MAG: (E)-4-hydroxy-3-methylbut-2-enyl-diphosphate synthase [Muribaculaceae bacterium]|nr:(E)-4-hydroxy-3-methylbut-2-enyl-diphosphate synthase [Muribaculaceae bacterium]
MEFNYNRRPTHAVRVGNIGIGGNNPIRLQSMTNTSTLDTEQSSQQALRIANAGGEIVRLTTQGEREASNMEAIGKRLRELGCHVPLVADVHFNPKAALRAAETCRKVRINPGNFADPGRVFKHLEYTDEQYQEEIERIRGAFIPFLDICRKHSTAVRLGVNHGSLSDRIMSRYGDTPEGMVESVMEYLRISREVDFHDIVISIKASNVVVMVQTVRLLAESMQKEGMTYPLHLGVTEAGDGEDGRVKSSVGIGTLLLDGLGDTIRVSLSEDPENEIPVARQLRDYIVSREGHAPIVEPEFKAQYPIRDQALPFPESWEVSSDRLPMVVGTDISADNLTANEVHYIDASSEPINFEDKKPIILTSKHVNAPAEIASWTERYVAAGGKNPIIVRLNYDGNDADDIEIKAGVDFGVLLLNGYANGIWLDTPGLSAEKTQSISLGLLQAVRLRISRTEYISCPSCGRTLFDLQKTLKEVKEATSHLKGLKIGVMGCIVNGPGEMADADYGYVGAGPGRVSLYKGKTLMIKNIPTEEALPALLELITHDNRPS